MGFWIWNRDKNVATELSDRLTGNLYGFYDYWDVSNDGTTITSAYSPRTEFLATTTEPLFFHGRDDFIVSNTKLINPRIVDSKLVDWCEIVGNNIKSATGGVYFYDENGDSITGGMGSSYAIAIPNTTYIRTSSSAPDPDTLKMIIKNNGNTEVIRVLKTPPQVGFSYAAGYSGFPEQIVCIWKDAMRKVDNKYMHGFNYGVTANYTQLRDDLTYQVALWKDARNVNFREGQYGGLAPYILQDLIHPPQIVTPEEYQSITGSTIDNIPEPYPEDLSIYGPGGDTTDPHNPYPEGDSPATVDPLDSGEETDSPETEGEWELPFDDVPDDPSDVHSVALGLYNAYALSAMQVEELANYLFSGITELGENLVKLIWGSKRDVIISLIEFPIMVTTQGSEEIRFIFDTELAGMFHGKQLTNEYLPIDFGTIEVPRYSGTFYDFEPYTTLTLYIPYIGYIDLKPTEVVGSTLRISGYIHLTTGEIAVNVKSSRTGRLGTYSGTIGRMLPIADADATEIYSAIIKTAASLGAVAVAGVGAASASSAAAGISAPSKHAVEIAQQDYQNALMDWGTATKGIRGKQAEMMNKGASYESAVSSYNEQSAKYNQVNKAASNSREDFHDAISEAGSNSIGAVTTGFNVSRGTIMTSSNGRLSPKRCFLRIEVPNQSVSRNQKILGYPANSADSLNSDRLHGYTELRAIELSIPRATLTELQELEDILKGGFYLP